MPNEEDSSELEENNALEHANIQGASAHADGHVDAIGANEKADDLGGSEKMILIRPQTMKMMQLMVKLKLHDDAID